MAAVGGSIDSYTLIGREFVVAADAESQRKLGGFENEVLANGNSTARLIKTRMPLLIDGLTTEIDDDKGDQEFLQDVANMNDFVTMNITYASGAVYQGSVQITGDFQASSQSATASVTFSGPGILTKQ